jgi:hypothetical protein
MFDTGEAKPAVPAKIETPPIKEPAGESALTTPQDGKLEDAIALLKAIEDLNKKILESNREILLRLKE